jgi:hypothetical protein
MSKSQYTKTKYPTNAGFARLSPNAPACIAFACFDYAQQANFNGARPADTSQKITIQVRQYSAFTIICQCESATLTAMSARKEFIRHNLSAPLKTAINAKN